jgi:hypothetical protein
MGVDTLLPPLPSTGLLGQIKANRENRTIAGSAMHSPICVSIGDQWIILAGENKLLTCS